MHQAILHIIFSEKTFFCWGTVYLLFFVGNTKSKIQCFVVDSEQLIYFYDKCFVVLHFACKFDTFCVNFHERSCISGTSLISIPIDCPRNFVIKPTLHRLNCFHILIINQLQYLSVYIFGLLMHFSASANKTMNVF